ncbi:MAG: hypothetical protein HOI66_23300, partial [Verrucomicrobia bacterium]|nr:hypothetical protein [Verrucomicrobiota bacterium]
MRLYLKQGGGGLGQNYYVTYPNGTKVKLDSSNSNLTNDIAYRVPYTPPVEVEVRGLDAVLHEDCTVPGACRFDFT